MCTVVTACSAVWYCTAAVRIVTVLVQILMHVVLYGNVLQQDEFLQYVYSS